MTSSNLYANAYNKFTMRCATNGLANVAKIIVRTRWKTVVPKICMNFLNSILKRPPNEKPFVLLVVGKPKDDCEIPVFATKKKSFSKIATIF